MNSRIDLTCNPQFEVISTIIQSRLVILQSMLKLDAQSSVDYFDSLLETLNLRQKQLHEAMEKWDKTGGQGDLSIRIEGMEQKLR